MAAGFPLQIQIAQEIWHQLEPEVRDYLQYQAWRLDCTVLGFYRLRFKSEICLSYACACAIKEGCKILDERMAALKSDKTSAAAGDVGRTKNYLTKKSERIGNDQDGPARSRAREVMRQALSTCKAMGFALSIDHEHAGELLDADTMVFHQCLPVQQEGKVSP